MYLGCAVRAHRPVQRARTLGTPFTDAAWLASSCGPCRWAPTHDQRLHSVTVRSAALNVRASPVSAARSERKSAHLWCRPWVRKPAQAGLARIAHCLPAGTVTGRGWCPGLDGLRRCSGCPGIRPSSHIAPTMAASKMASVAINPTKIPLVMAPARCPPRPSPNTQRRRADSAGQHCGPLFEVVVIRVRALRAVRVADRQHPVRSPAAPTRAVNAVVLLVSRWPPDQLTRGWLSLAGVREAGPQPGSGRPAANDQFSPGSRRARRRLRVLPAATLRGCSGPSAEPLSAC